MKKNIFIIILSFLVVGLAGFIAYDNFFAEKDSKETSCTTQLSDTEEESKKEEVKEEKKKVRYFQYLIGDDESYKAREISLDIDDNVKYQFGGNASGGETYTGKYLENDKYLVLVMERSVPDGTVCDPKNSLYSCNLTISLTKGADGTLVLDEEYAFENVAGINSYTFKNVEKTNLKLLTY